MFDDIGAKGLSRRLVLGGLGALAAGGRGRRAAADAPLRPAPPADASEPFAADYGVWLGGLRLGSVALRVALEPGRYRATAAARSAGAAAWLFSLTAEAEVEGALAGAIPAPERFRAEGAFGEERRRVIFRFEPALEIDAEPPFRERGYEPRPEHLRGAIDPISAAVAACAPHPSAAAGGRTLPVFDGRRRIDLRIGPARETGEGRLRADAQAVPVAGFKTKHLRRPPIRLSLQWRVRDGLAMLERAWSDTPFGAALLRRV